MFIQYNNLDIVFRLEHTRFRVLNIAREQLHRIIPQHSHGEGSYEIHFNASGCGQVLVNGVLHTLSPGSVYLVGPHVSHAQIPGTEGIQTDDCIYFQMSKPSEAFLEPLVKAFSTISFWIGKDRNGMEELLDRLFEELEAQRQGYTVVVEALLKQLIIAMLRNCDTMHGTEQFAAATPAEARGFIIEESFLYEYATLTLQQLADKLGFGARQTQRLLLTLYGKTFQQKRCEARMSAASILLIYSGQSIASIAEALGYASAEHFSSSFRRYFGVSAREYRRTHATVSPTTGPVLEPPDGLRSAVVHERNGK